MHMMRCTDSDESIPDPDLLATVFRHTPFGIVITVDQQVRYYTHAFSNHLSVDDTLDSERLAPFHKVHEHIYEHYCIHYFQCDETFSEQH